MAAWYFPGVAAARWTYPSSPQSANSPPINLSPHNTTLPLPTASSTVHRPTPTPTKPSTPLPWLSGPASTPVSCPDPSREVWLAAGLGLETPHPTYSTPPPRKPQTECQDQTDPCPCFPPPSIQPLFHLTHLCHPQRSSPSPLPAHTRGGCVCGRGGVRCRFWRWASVG
jgi:hypothetical protein